MVCSKLFGSGVNELSVDFIFHLILLYALNWQTAFTPFVSGWTRTDKNLAPLIITLH